MAQPTQPAIAERTQRAISDVENALSDTLGRLFPEASSGDERPHESIRFSQALRDLIRAWVEDNVPARSWVPVLIGSSGEHAKCAVCGLSVSLILPTEANGMTSRRFCDGPGAYPDHVPAPMFYPGRVTVRDLIKKLQAEPNPDVPVLIGTDGWYKYVGDYHAGPSDGMDENGGYALPTIDEGAEWDATDL